MSKTLAGLVEGGFLVSRGATRATVYFFQDKVPRLEHPAGSSQHKEESSQHLGSSSQHLLGSSQHLPSSSQHLEELLPVAAPVREHKKVAQTVMRQTIIRLCEGRFLTAQELAELLRRNAMALQNHYLNSMVRQRRLRLKYPETLTHPQQAYTAAKSGDETKLP